MSNQADYPATTVEYADEDASRSKRMDVQVVGCCSNTLAMAGMWIIAAGNGHKQHFPVKQLPSLVRHV